MQALTHILRPRKPSIFPLILLPDTVKVLKNPNENQQNCFDVFSELENFINS